MPLLTGPQTEELQKLLTTTFRLDDLAQVVRFKLDLVLENVVAVARPLPDVTFDLIEWMEYRGRTRDLLRVVRDARSGVPEVCRFCDPFLSAPPDPAAAPGAGGPPDPNRVLGLVVAFRAVFEERRIWFDRLDAYKTLHDVLHNLQEQQVAIRLAAQQFRAPPNDALALRIIADTLDDDLLSRAKQALPNTEFPDKQGKWVRAFEQAVRGLRAALDAPDPGALSRAVDVLGTLHNQQADLNAELVSCAKRLRTDDLVQRMEAILAGLGQGAAERAAGLRVRLTRFTASCQRLAALALDHDACQEVETSLAVVPANGATRDAVFQWPDVLAGILRIAARRPDDRMAARMAEYARGFDTATDPKAAPAQFALLREQFGRLFYKTDKDLLAVTGTLVRDAEQLGTELGGFA
jgi:hypothetical protein